jgi:hypothetical protein
MCFLSDAAGLRGCRAGTGDQYVEDAEFASGMGVTVRGRPRAGHKPPGLSRTWVVRDRPG